MRSSVITTVALALALASETACTADAKGALACPPGTTAERVATSKELRTQAYFPQFEAYCVKAGAPTVRHGPFVQYGPNGERLVEGAYVEGKEDGVWIHRLPSQTQRWTWVRGRRDEKPALTAAEGFRSIDVAACIVHGFGFPVGLGSGRYTVTGRTGDLCEVHLGGETERARHGTTVCRFPVALGRVGFSVDETGHFDLGAASAHCAK